MHTAFNILGATRTLYSAGWILVQLQKSGEPPNIEIGKFNLPALDRGAFGHGRSLLLMIVLGGPDEAPAADAGS